MVRDYKLLGRAELTSTLVKLRAEMEDLEETIRFYYLNSAAHINGGEVLRDEETMAELKSGIAEIEALINRTEP